MAQGLFLAGDVMLALYTSGVVGPYSDPINASELVLNQPAADVKTRPSHGKSNYGTTLGSVSLPKAEELSLKFDEASASLLALALRGSASTFTSTPPSAGSATASSVNCQFAAVGSPTGRAARRHWWLTVLARVLLMGCLLGVLGSGRW